MRSVVKQCKICEKDILVKPCLINRKKYCSMACRNEGLKRNPIRYWKGKKLSEETRTKMSKTNKGRKPWNTGKKRPEITGEKHPLYGKKHSEEAKRKMSIARKGKFAGENHPRWQGGKSFEPYTVDWTQTLKRSIRERDKYICQLCGQPQEDEALCVHHIDYDKKNCSPKNLISLCRKCHNNTNTNREYWIKYFINQLT